MATVLVSTGECQGSLGEGVCLPQAAGQHLRLPQRETTEGLIVDSLRCGALVQGLCEQSHSIRDAPGQGIRCPQGRSDPGEPDREIRVLTDAHGSFEQGKRPREVPVAEG